MTLKQNFIAANDDKSIFQKYLKNAKLNKLEILGK
jgi:hypothetical protein